MLSGSGNFSREFMYRAWIKDVWSLAEVAISTDFVTWTSRKFLVEVKWDAWTRMGRLVFFFVKNLSANQFVTLQRKKFILENENYFQWWNNLFICTRISTYKAVKNIFYFWRVTLPLYYYSFPQICHMFSLISATFYVEVVRVIYYRLWLSLKKQFLFTEESAASRI